MVDHKREDRTPPLARVMGVGRQQQQANITLTLTSNLLQVDEEVNL